MTMLDGADEDHELADFSLCADCAIEPSLKHFVRTRAHEGARCGICLLTSPEAIVCGIEHRTALANLVRALIRFHYDEMDYNSHFGGVSPSEILGVVNPIVALPPAPPSDSVRSDDVGIFIEDLAAQLPPPHYDQGIWIYHQNENSGLARAISRTESSTLKTLRRRIARENHFKVEPAVKELITRIGTRIDIRIEPGQRFYRARLGVSKQLWRTNGLASGRPVWLPHRDAELGAPPSGIATIGRLNRNAVSFLYLASDAETAACEVRPHPGQELSVGQFEINRILKVANFEGNIADFSASDLELDLYHFVHSTNVAMSRPVLPSATSAYSVTQLIADVLRQEEYDGVSFDSSVGSGHNVCLFDPDVATYIDGSATVRRVETVLYELDGLDTVQDQSPDDLEI